MLSVILQDRAVVSLLGSYPRGRSVRILLLQLAKFVVYLSKYLEFNSSDKTEDKGGNTLVVNSRC